MTNGSGTNVNVNVGQQEVIDVEQFGREGRPVPPGHRYRIRIDRDRFVVEEPCLTGAQILGLAGKAPDTHMLSQKLRGGQAREVQRHEKVDFTQPGIERFMTLPLDTTEGGDPCD